VLGAEVLQDEVVSLRTSRWHQFRTIKTTTPTRFQRLEHLPDKLVRV
jgi:hypothetical protein